MSRRPGAARAGAPRSGRGRGRGRRLALGVEIVLGYLRVRWLLARRDVVAAVAELRRGVPPGAGGPAAVAAGRRLARPVRRALDPLPADTRCLMRSLVLLGMLAARGIGAELVIGVRPRDGRALAAHAWLEHDGAALLPPYDYAELARL